MQPYEEPCLFSPVKRNAVRIALTPEAESTPADVRQMFSFAGAIESFEAALALEPGHAAASESLESMRSFAAERWHFRMLNDRERNREYDRAVRRAVTRRARAVARRSHARGRRLRRRT